MEITPKTLKEEVRKIAQQEPDFAYSEQDIRQQYKEFLAHCSYTCGIGTNNISAIKKLYGENPTETVDRNTVSGLSERLHNKYVHDAESGKLGYSCIVGQAMKNLGATTEDLIFYDSIGGVGEVLVQLGFSKEDEGFMWLVQVQTSQDANVPWGEAVAVADAS